MKKSFLFVLVSLLIISLGGASSADAQGRVIRCESRNDTRTYCPIGGAFYKQVRFKRRLSKSSCDEGRSWGVDRRGIWVDRGCRAEFEIVHSGQGYDGYHPSDSGFGGRESSISRAWEKIKREREELRRERDRLERDKAEFEREKERFYSRSSGDRCPSGFRPGRCSDKQRRQGCRDMRTRSGLGCMGFR